MTALFISMVLAVFAGGVSLWLSGLFLGRRLRVHGMVTAAAAQIERMRSERDQFEVALTDARARMDETEWKSKSAEAARFDTEGDLKRALEKISRLENEIGRAKIDNGNLAAENADLRSSVEDLRRRKTPSDPPPNLGSNEELDYALAQLDMERVAHQRTRNELDTLKKKGGNGRVSSVPPIPPPGSVDGVERRGAGFRTVSMASRGQQVSATDHDRLKQVNDQLAREKARIELELSRTQKELQTLLARARQ